MSELEDAIRTRAHQIWESEGRPEGRERDHWFRAASEMPEADAAAGTGIAGGPPPATEEPTLPPPKDGA